MRQILFERIQFAFKHFESLLNGSNMHSNGSNLHLNALNHFQMVRISIRMPQIRFEWFEYASEWFESLSKGSNLYSNASNPFRVVLISI